MSHKTTGDELIDIWNELANQVAPKAVRIDVKAELSETESQALDDSHSLLSLHLTLLDEALHFLLLLHKLTMEKRKNANPKPSPSFLFLLSRVCTLTVAIRKLVVSGLEDAARPIARSLLETFDLAMIVLVDEDFATTYAGDENGYDENEFWKKHIAYGKVDDKIRHVLTTIGFDTDAQEMFFETRKADKKVLSSAVHSSVTIAFIALIRPSLVEPGRVSMSTLGHVSAYSPELLKWVITELYHFDSVVMKLLMLHEPPLSFSSEISEQTLDSVIAGFLTYQELFTRYENSLSPSIIFPE